MLVRLRPGTLGGVDHEQEEVDPGGAGDHRPDEALVARDVDERQPTAVGELERRVAEVDRDAASLFLRQPIRVLAGQRPHEPRLAVVDVPGGADRQRHHVLCCITLITAPLGSRTKKRRPPQGSFVSGWTISNPPWTALAWTRSTSSTSIET